MRQEGDPPFPPELPVPDSPFRQDLEVLSAGSESTWAGVSVCNESEFFAATFVP